MVLLLLAVVLRLPQFVAGQMVVDGDEAIEGLMAKHLMEGKSFSPLFSGQRYGFSLLESGTAALFFTLFGVSCASLKAAMLVLWIIGVSLFVFAMRRLKGETAALITGVGLLFTPSWAAWSMKARGGYVTAFLLLGLALWLISIWKKEGSAPGPPAWRSPAFWLGIICGFIFLSQPFFFLGTLAFLPVAVSGKDKGKKLAWLALGCGLALASYLAYVPRGADLSSPPQIISSWLPRIDPKWIIGCLVTTFKGSFIYGESVDLGIMTKAAGVLGMILTFLFIILRASALRRRRTYDVTAAAGLGLFAVSAITLFAQHDLFGCRYLLAVPALSAVLGGGMIPDFLRQGPNRRRIITAAFVACELINAAAVIEFRNLTFYGKVRDASVSERRVLNRLLSELDRRHVVSVYSLDPLLQWVVTFESREKVVCRWLSRIDRSPAYIERVDRDLLGGRPVALVGLYDQRGPILNRLAGYPDAARDYREISKRYAVLFSPPRSLLESLGFLITEFRSARAPMVNRKRKVYASLC